MFFLVGLAWGSSFLFIDIVLDSLAPGVVTFLPVGLGAVTLAALPKPPSGFDRSDWMRTFIMGAVWLALPETLLPLAQGLINSAVTGMLVGAVPVMTALVASALLRRRPGGAQVVGLLSGLVGVALISAPSVTDSETRHHQITHCVEVLDHHLLSDVYAQQRASDPIATTSPSDQRPRLPILDESSSMPGPHRRRAVPTTPSTNIARHRTHSTSLAHRSPKDRLPASATSSN